MNRMIPAVLAALVLAAPVAASAMDDATPAPHLSPHMKSSAMKHDATKKHDAMKTTTVTKHASGSMKHETTMKHAPSPKPTAGG